VGTGGGCIHYRFVGLTTCYTAVEDPECFLSLTLATTSTNNTRKLGIGGGQFGCGKEGGGWYISGVSVDFTEARDETTT
jgi:hypothetical protein